jgi:hypothetical protein
LLVGWHRKGEKNLTDNEKIEKKKKKPLIFWGFFKRRERRKQRVVWSVARARGVASHTHTRTHVHAERRNDEKTEKKSQNLFFFLKFCGEGAAQESAQGEREGCGKGARGGGIKEQQMVVCGGMTQPLDLVEVYSGAHRAALRLVHTLKLSRHPRRRCANQRPAPTRRRT